MRILVLMCFFCILITNINSADWPHWRGPNQNGTSSEIDLIDQWEEGGDQLLWKADFVGRSTPIVMNDKVYVIGRSGREITEQEQIACFSVKMVTYSGIINSMCFIQQFLSTELVGQVLLVILKLVMFMYMASKVCFLLLLVTEKNCGKNL